MPSINFNKRTIEKKLLFVVEMEVQNENLRKIRKWKAIVENLLFLKNICSICLEVKPELKSCDEVYHIKNEDMNVEHTLQEIMSFTFGWQVSNLLPTTFLCDECVTIILNSYLMLIKIKNNHEILHKYFNIVTYEVKHTQECLEDCDQCFIKIDNVIKEQVFGIKSHATKKKNSMIKPAIAAKAVIFKIKKSDSGTDNDNDKDLVEIAPKYECPHCGMKINHLSLIRNHITKSHSKETCFECPKCPRMFSTLNMLVKHRNVGHHEKISYCDLCTVILCNIEKEEHKTQDHLKLIYECATCLFEFESKSRLSKHISNTHMTCQHCYQSFNNHFKLSHHRCLYKCLECKEKCLHNKYLISYREQNLANKKLFKCTDCEFTYKARNQLISHVNEAHLKHFPYLCDLCGEKFASRPLLRIHTYKEHENDISAVVVTIEGSNEHLYKCETCGSLLNSEEEYTSHRKRHFEEKCECHFCCKVFCSTATLNMHLKRHHPNEKDGHNTSYQCTMCTSNFNYKTDYLEHIATHPQGSLHICRTCNEKFRSKLSYYSHVRKHRIKYDRECHICFKKYTKHTISRHIKNHMNSDDNNSTVIDETQKEVMCDLCGVLLRNQEALIKHNEIHKEKQCPHCKKQINSIHFTKHLKTHMKQETKLKSCPKCDYTTKFLDCLKGHMNRHHLNIRPYQCEVCSKTFHAEHILKGHRMTHLERPEYNCEICSKKFISKKALMLHTRIHTGERPYPCDLCDMSFLSASRRKQHEIRKHFEPSVECKICDKKLYTQSDLRRHVVDCHSGESKRKRKRQ